MYVTSPPIACPVYDGNSATLIKLFTIVINLADLFKWKCETIEMDADLCADFENLLIIFPNRPTKVG
jgi:hypothetical protein